jgi:hypothetical protein
MIDLPAFRSLLHDHRWYARTFLRIKDKGGNIQRLEYNVAQERVSEVWDRLEAEGKPVRLIILKARREGISTYVAGRFVHRAATRKGRSALVIAHEEKKSAAKIFDIYKLMYDQLPPKVLLDDGKTVQVKPKKRYSNKRELVFDDLLSDITVASAGGDKGKDKSNKSGGTGRGGTYQMLHASEYAFWPAASETALALFNTVDKQRGTVVIIESTANGVGDDFHRRWLEAKAGRSSYVPIFLSWLDFPAYRSPVPAGGLGPLDDEEKRLQAKYNATDEQLQWRRETIADECKTADMFRQEYPSDDEEAFLVSGRPFFDRQSVIDMRDKHQRPPIAVGNLVERDGKIEFVENPGGYVSIWAWPRKDGRYCIGADVAEGLEKGDYSDARVMDRDKGEMVATWHGHIDPDLYGAELTRLGRFFFNAWLGVEVNNHGLTTNKAVLREGYRRLYERQRLDEEDPQDTEKLGWKTDTLTRPVMLDDLEQAIREGTITDHDERAISEYLTFVRNAKGKPEAQEGCFDDLVVAGAITLQMHQLCPLPRIISDEERRRRERERRLATQPRNRRTGY